MIIKARLACCQTGLLVWGGLKAGVGVWADGKQVDMARAMCYKAAMRI